MVEAHRVAFTRTETASLTATKSVTVSLARPRHHGHRATDCHAAQCSEATACRSSGLFNPTGPRVGGAGETWQEFLGAHLREPVKNFGVGGYSVHQAFRRMQRVELEGPEVASLVVLNIYDDDHFRNLDSLRSIRSPGTGQPFTLPHLHVDLHDGSCTPVENLCPTAADIMRLGVDDAWLLETFADDPVLSAVLTARAEEAEAGRSEKSDVERAEFEELSKNNVNFGLGSASTTAGDQHAAAALLATRHVVTEVEQLCEQIGARFMLVLSFSEGVMAAALHGQPRFDETFLEFLRDKPYPVIDMRCAYLR